MIPANTIKRWRLSLASESGRLRVSQIEAAERLLVPTRTYARWEKEGCPNHMLLLAMGAVSYGLAPYPK